MLRDTPDIGFAVGLGTLLCGIVAWLLSPLVLIIGGLGTLALAGYFYLTKET